MLVLPVLGLLLLLATANDRKSREAVIIPLYNRAHPALKRTRLESPEFYRSLYWK